MQAVEYTFCSLAEVLSMMFYGIKTFFIDEYRRILEVVRVMRTTVLISNLFLSLLNQLLEINKDLREETLFN